MEDNEQKVIINIKFEESDILHIYKINFKNQFRKKMTFYKLLIGIFVGIFILLIFVYTLNGNVTTSSMEVSDTYVSSPSLLPIMILAIVIISVVFLLPKKLREEAIKNFETNKEFQNEIEYSISEKEISGHSITTEFHYDWSYFNKAVETNDAFVLYLSNNTVIYLPKRFFINKYDIDIVNKIIKDKFKGQKYQYLK